MTTLQLARVVAEAAREATSLDAARAVLDALENNGCWFCRLTEADGITVDAPFARDGKQPPPALEDEGVLPFDGEVLA